MYDAAELAEQVSDFVLKEYGPEEGPAPNAFSSHPSWARLRELGTELWLDTGSIQESAALWTAEFSALTTNNTLLNREVGSGQYDSLIAETRELLSPYDLSDEELNLEIAFVLNAAHGLRLVEEYGAYVSVEEHTDLANDVESAVFYARRYHEVCPDRFIVKIPFTPAGLLATRILSEEGVPVNHTLGFSARQNYVIARIGRPAYVNVFMGRLNSFIADNDLGNGNFVGEKATLASQAAVRELRAAGQVPSRQIGASMRGGEQVRDLAGIDVMTIPPKAARGFLDLGIPPAELVDGTGRQPEPGVRDDVDPAEIRIENLWEIDDRLVACLDALENEDLQRFSPSALLTFFADRGCGDILVRWTDDHRTRSIEEGKIPDWRHWKDELRDGRVGLDAIMNLAGLNAFVADQHKMDDHIQEA